MHWMCENKLLQPTCSTYYCNKCNIECNIPENIGSHLTHLCAICQTRKQADQFCKMIFIDPDSNQESACNCLEKNNRTCAVCVYTIIEKSGDDLHECKCPFCRFKFNSIQNGKYIVSIENADNNNFQVCEDATGNTDTYFYESFGGIPDIHDNWDSVSEHSHDSDYVEENCNFIIGGERHMSTRRKICESSDESSNKRKAVFSKRGDDSKFQLVGSLPNLITDHCHKLSRHDTHEQRQKMLKKYVDKLKVKKNDLLDPFEIRPAYVSLHCFVLLLKANYAFGKSKSSSLTKHPKRIFRLMSIDNGLMGKFSFTRLGVHIANAAANAAAEFDFQKSNRLNTPKHRIIKDYMSAFYCYCSLLEREKNGELNAILDD
jgi:hypothetical protein